MLPTTCTLGTEVGSTPRRLTDVSGDAVLDRGAGIAMALAVIAALTDARPAAEEEAPIAEAPAVHAANATAAPSAVPRIARRRRSRAVPFVRRTWAPLVEWRSP